MDHTSESPVGALGPMLREELPIACTHGRIVFWYMGVSPETPAEAATEPRFAVSRNRTTAVATGYADLADAIGVPYTRRFPNRLGILLRSGGTAAVYVSVPFTRFMNAHICLPPHVFYSRDLAVSSPPSLTPPPPSPLHGGGSDRQEGEGEDDDHGDHDDTDDNDLDDEERAPLLQPPEREYLLREQRTNTVEDTAVETAINTAISEALQREMDIMSDEEEQLAHIIITTDSEASDIDSDEDARTIDYPSTDEEAGGHGDEGDDDDDDDGIVVTVAPLGPVLFEEGGGEGDGALDDGRPAAERLIQRWIRRNRRRLSAEDDAPTREDREEEEEEGEECAICCEVTELVRAPCERSHAVCASCLVRHATGHRLPVSRVDPSAICCPVVDCLGSYSLMSLAPLLGGPRLADLEERLARHHEAHHPTTFCIECETPARIISPERDEGFIIVRCSGRRQGGAPCNRRYCAFCLRDVGDAPRCEACLVPEFLRPPEMARFNYYIGLEGGGFARNFQLTPERVADVLEEIISTDEAPPSVRCRVCDGQYAQASACSEVSCCGAKLCSGCGRSSLPGALLIDHWENPAVGGERCPRYHWIRPGELSSVWAERMSPSQDSFAPHERCVERTSRNPDGCFGEDCDCALEAHAGFRRSYYRARRQTMAAALIRSLPQDLRRPAMREITRRRRRRELAAASDGPSNPASIAAAAAEAAMARAAVQADMGNIEARIATGTGQTGSLSLMLRGLGVQLPSHMETPTWAPTRAPRRPERRDGEQQAAHTFGPMPRPARGGQEPSGSA